MPELSIATEDPTIIGIDEKLHVLNQRLSKLVDNVNYGIYGKEEIGDTDSPVPVRFSPSLKSIEVELEETLHHVSTLEGYVAHIHS